MRRGGVAGFGRHVANGHRGGYDAKRLAFSQAKSEASGGPMIKSILLALFVLGQAAVLLLFGLATLWWSEDLMRWLIWEIGEERALGAQSVIHLEGGGTLLTNPGAMMLWTLPFWFLGAVQILSAMTLVWLWVVGRAQSRRITDSPGARPA